MTSSTLLATLVLPALAGLVVGFVAGLFAGAAAMLRWIHRHLPPGADVPIYDDETNPTPGHRPWRGREHFSKLGLLLVLLGILGFVAGVISLVQIRDVSHCLADFAQRSATVNQARAEAGDIDRAADKQARDATQDSVDAIVSIFDLPKDLSPEDRQKTSEEYREIGRAHV